MEILFETVGRIVIEYVTADKNKEISEHIHKINKFMIIWKNKKNKIQKKYILEAEGGTRNSPLFMYFPFAPVPPMPGLFA